MKLLDCDSYALRLSVIQSAGNLLLHTSVPEDNTSENRRQSTYQNVSQKRASILVRRQSIAQSNEKEPQSESKETELRTIDLKTAVSILQLLQERGHDVNAFVRSATLRTISLLCSEGLVPLNEYVNVTKTALERVKDKAVLVRKNAINVSMLI